MAQSKDLSFLYYYYISTEMHICTPKDPAKTLPKPTKKADPY